MQFPYPSLRQGLVGAWCPSLGATGYTLLDRSGRGNNGTLTNMDGQDNWQASETGRSLYFDGTNDYATCTKSLAVSSPLSFSIWFKPNGSQVVGAGLMMNRNATPGMCGFLLDASAGVRLHVTWRGGDWDTNTGANIALNEWQFAYVAILQTTYTLYFFKRSGLTKFTSTLGSPGAAVWPMEFGRDSVSTGRYFKGWIDDARLYNRALTDSEILLLASRRGIGLTPSGSTRATYPTKFQIKVGGPWREADAYQNVAGVWQTVPPSIKVAGVWK
jgi:hypothetical protein